MTIGPIWLASPASPARLRAADPGQAAAEYVGTTIGSALRSVGAAAGSAVEWVGEHPWVIAIVVLGLWLFWKVLKR